jgi:hypothetical protein
MKSKSSRSEKRMQTRVNSDETLGERIGRDSGTEVSLIVSSQSDKESRAT